MRIGGMTAVVASKRVFAAVLALGLAGGAHAALGADGSSPAAPDAVAVRTVVQVPLNVQGLEISTLDNVQQMNLPSGNWVVQAQATFGSNAAAERNIACALLDTNNQVSQANTHTTAAAQFSASLSLVGISDGGPVSLACATDPEGAFVRERSLVATRVGSVTIQ